MSEHTTDPNDERLTHGSDTTPQPQAPVYLILSEAERKAGFVRPVRRTYVHSRRTADSSIEPCGMSTRMSQAIAETYARDPHFYGATYCVSCGMHLPVNQFTWLDNPDELVGS